MTRFRPERILDHATLVPAPDGELYYAATWREGLANSSWIGWLGFEPLTPGRPFRRTERETTQSSREAPVHWASNLQPAYVTAAFTRAR